jgi:hypothetical protein
MLQKYFEIDDEGMLFNIAVNKTFTTCGDGYWSNVVKDVFVESISMFISTVGDEGDYCDGDLAVNYTQATWDNATDGLIYTDSAFLAQVQEFLISKGFDIEAVNAITYSEQGMQDEERVSCDAYDFADYVRKVINVTEDI